MILFNGPVTKVFKSGPIKKRAGGKLQPKQKQHQISESNHWKMGPFIGWKFLREKKNGSHGLGSHKSISINFDTCTLNDSLLNKNTDFEVARNYDALIIIAYIQVNQTFIKSMA